MPPRPEPPRPQPPRSELRGPEPTQPPRSELPCPEPTEPTAGSGDVPGPRIHQPRLAEMGAPAVGRPDTVGAHLAKGERRGDGTIWRSNPREQGLIGLTDAIAWFGSRGCDVCLPLIDSQPYDLVVDDGERLRKVQVKTTTAKSPYGIYVVGLTTNGGNQSFHTAKAFDPSAIDLLYVLTDDRSHYVIPADAIRGTTSLNLGSHVSAYRVAG